MGQCRTNNYTTCRISFKPPCSSLLSCINAISDPSATITVAIRPIAVPSRANPRNVNAVKPKAIERYALRKKSRNRPSRSDSTAMVSGTLSSTTIATRSSSEAGSLSGREWKTRMLVIRVDESVHGEIFAELTSLCRVS